MTSGVTQDASWGERNAARLPRLMKRQLRVWDFGVGSLWLSQGSFLPRGYGLVPGTQWSILRSEEGSEALGTGPIFLGTRNPGTYLGKSPEPEHCFPDCRMSNILT